MRRVILPQAIRVFLPPYGNTMIMMLKDSSIASAITVAELTRGRAADRGVDVQEHDGVHAGGASVSRDEPAADLLRAPARAAGSGANDRDPRRPQVVRRASRARRRSRSRSSQGEVVCVIGPSGSGKSTLLRCINGLKSYDDGEITIDGAAVRSRERLDPRDPERGRHGVPALQSFPASHCARERDGRSGVREARAARRSERARAARCSRKVGLAQQGRRLSGRSSPAASSSASRSRARWRCSPKAILFDEPTSRARSGARRRGAQGRCRRSPRDGMTMIVVTHEMGFAARGRAIA